MSTDSLQFIYIVLFAQDSLLRKKAESATALQILAVLLSLF